MLGLDIHRPEDGNLQLLCLGAHSDDIEIGCGGTILKLLDAVDHVDVRWVVLGAMGTRAAEARESAEAFLEKAGSRTVVVEGFRDGFFPYIGGELKEYFETLKKSVAPHVIFTHFRGDLHQDHRIVSELTWNTFRDHLVLEYEILKYDGDLSNPNLFVHLPRDTARRKVERILRCFTSQRGRAWFTESALTALMRVRGVESNAPEELAEAFHCRKAVWRG
jgi:LmbE family N-acetylglucosaminyl deacetylase